MLPLRSFDVRIGDVGLKVTEQLNIRILKYICIDQYSNNQFNFYNSNIFLINASKKII